MLQRVRTHTRRAVTMHCDFTVQATMAATMEAMEATEATPLVAVAVAVAAAVAVAVAVAVLARLATAGAAVAVGEGRLPQAAGHAVVAVGSVVALVQALTTAWQAVAPSANTLRIRTNANVQLKPHFLLSFSVYYLCTPLEGQVVVTARHHTVDCSTSEGGGDIHELQALVSAIRQGLVRLCNGLTHAPLLGITPPRMLYNVVKHLRVGERGAGVPGVSALPRVGCCRGVAD